MMITVFIKGRETRNSPLFSRQNAYSRPVNVHFRYVWLNSYNSYFT
ncbi:hypothetical protein VCRA2119O48_300015 [Vibrio crassostreae]|nr:hypothetical protein VCRA2119O48_300015 [Vibrio crassostreae]CAK3878242.1 hypothetical protein VCRA212O16_290051 [Vibrio crassostreae]